MKRPDWNSHLAESYDLVAKHYAEKFVHELDQKPFDRELLDRFAERLSDRGRVCDLGCGPGHVALYLQARGLDVFGIDLSPQMIELARRLNPGIAFEQGDMLALGLPDSCLAGVMAFYSLIHTARSAIPDALNEMNRVLAPDGVVLVAVHGGESEIHADEFLGRPVSIDVTLFEPAEIAAYLESAGFRVDEVLSRDPYDFEFQSQRVYVVGTKPRAPNRC